MEFFTNQKNTKKIIIAILLVMTFNFIAPNISFADDDDDVFGGKLFEPLFQLIATVGDLVIRGLQKLFLGDGTIELENPGNLANDGAYNTYFIRYGPAMIFSNEVPGLDANFVNPKYTEDTPYSVTTIGQYTEDDKLSEVFWVVGSSVKSLDDIQNGLSTYMYLKNNNIEFNNSSIRQTFRSEDINSITNSIKNGTKVILIADNINFDEWQMLIYYDKYCIVVNGSNNKTEKNISQEIRDADSGNDAATITLTVDDQINNATSTWGKIITDAFSEYDTISAKVIPTENSTATGATKVSTSYQLRDTIATYYKALKAIVLVGLLSVLVYIGIRIILSSTGQEKAKYKKMIIDWVVAICMLYVLHYIMVFTMEITEQILNIFKGNLLGDSGEDILMSTIRNSIINSSYSDLTSFTNLILYIVLVIQTCVFTIHYLKRLVYLAFFTMIAPLVAFTYPLDKIKDGQAQAFTLWIREYTFNALLPVMHIVLYYIMVGSAVDFAVNNPLYAIIAIGFLTTAEKFFRKMFGFEKASSVSQIGAAAGGALVMNAINKMGQRAGQHAAGKGGPGGSSGSGGNAGIRTANGSPLTALQSGSGGTQAPAGGTTTPGSPAPRSGGTRTAVPNGAGGGSGGGGASRGNTRKRNISGVAKGVGNVIKKQTFTKPAIKRNLGALAGIAGAGIGTTIGLAAGVATGDFSNAVKYGTAGLYAGSKGGKGLVNAGFNAADSIRTGLDNVAYDFQTGQLGEEAAQNKKFDREFKRSPEYKNILKNYGSGSKSDVQQMLDAGITDSKRMNTILKCAKNYNTDVSHAMAYNQLANDCSDSVLYDNNKLRMFLNKRGITANTDQELEKLRKSMIDFK